MNSIAFKYSNKLIENKYYQTISVSGDTNVPLVTLKSDGTWTPGVVYIPYFLGTKEEFIKWKKAERKKKLEKLNKLNLE